MYIVIGGSGFLGRYIIENILKTTEENIIGTYTKNCPSKVNERLRWVECDVQNTSDISYLNKISEDDSKVIYLASYASPDFCEKNPSVSWDLNITALADFVNKFEKVNCLYYASTDVVYGEGKKDVRFSEDFNINPVNIYGKQKALAEQIVLSKGYNVFRLPLMMGPSLVDNKKHFFDIILEHLSCGKEIEMFTDLYRSTISFNQAAEYLVQLIEKYGNCNEKIINFGADNPLSKYDLGLLLAKEYNYNKELVKPVTANQNQNIFYANRALVTAMDNSKLKKLLGLDFINFEICTNGECVSC